MSTIVGEVEVSGCPWCGWSSQIDPDGSHGEWWAVCMRTECSATGPIRSTPEEAAAAWNELSAMRAKHRINLGRKWGAPDAEGVVRHIENTDPPAPSAPVGGGGEFEWISPLPWSVTSDGWLTIEGQRVRCFEIGCSGGATWVAQVLASKGSLHEGEGEANTRFIVRAVNAYPTLLARCTAMEGEVERLRGALERSRKVVDLHDQLTGGRYTKTLGIIDAALTQPTTVEGESGQEKNGGVDGVYKER